jgi:hypothetical protein
VVTASLQLGLLLCLVVAVLCRPCHCVCKEEAVANQVVQRHGAPRVDVLVLVVPVPLLRLGADLGVGQVLLGEVLLGVCGQAKVRQKLKGALLAVFWSDHLKSLTPH